MTVSIGQIVRLKPARAEAYGFDPGTTYRVIDVYTRNGYRTPWVRLEGGGMVAPLNAVKATELR